MDLKQAMVIFKEDGGEGIKHLVCAEPDIPGLSQCYAGLEVRRVGFAHNAIDTVGGNQQIIAIKLGKVVYLVAEFQCDPKLEAAALQDIQQALARNAGNYMTCATYFLAAIVDIDVIPDHKVVGDLLVRFIIGSLERGQRPVGKYDAPAVGNIYRVALDDGNRIRGIGFFDEHAPFTTSRPSPKATA